MSILDGPINYEAKASYSLNQTTCSEKLKVTGIRCNHYLTYPIFLYPITCIPVNKIFFFLSFIKTYIVTYKQQNNNIIYQECINKSKLQKVSNIKVQFAILICFYIY